MKSRTILASGLVLYLIVQAFALPAQNTSSGEFDSSPHPNELGADEHLQILALGNSTAPQLLRDKSEILFTYKQGSIAETLRRQGYENQLAVGGIGPRQVAIAFGHEQYRYLHPMKRNPEGVYFYYLGYSDTFLQEERHIAYRFVVDGVWLEDPQNPQRMRMYNGSLISLVALPEAPLFPKTTPILSPATAGLSGKTTTFILEEKPGQDIYVSGSFNSWDPFLHKLVEKWDMPGVYELSLHLPPGTYYYHFASGGRSILDPRNDRYGTSEQGLVYSRFRVD